MCPRKPDQTRPPAEQKLTIRHYTNQPGGACEASHPLGGNGAGAPPLPIDTGLVSAPSGHRPAARPRLQAVQTPARGRGARELADTRAEAALPPQLDRESPPQPIHRAQAGETAARSSTNGRNTSFGFDTVVERLTSISPRVSGSVLVRLSRCGDCYSKM